MLKAIKVRLYNRPVALFQRLEIWCREIGNITMRSTVKPSLLFIYIQTPIKSKVVPFLKRWISFWKTGLVMIQVNFSWIESSLCRWVVVTIAKKGHQNSMDNTLPNSKMIVATSECSDWALSKTTLRSLNLYLSVDFLTSNLNGSEHEILLYVEARHGVAYHLRVTKRHIN